MGDESIIAPPRSKNAASTGTSAPAAAVSGGTLNVSQLPTPSAGSVSPETGIVLMIGAPDCASERAGQAGSAAAAASLRRTSRRRAETGPSIMSGWRSASWKRRSLRCERVHPMAYFAHRDTLADDGRGWDNDVYPHLPRPGSRRA